MPNPQFIHHILLTLTFLFLAASFFRRSFFVCAYLLIMMNRPGLYYPLLGQIRFELIVAIWAVALLVMGRETAVSLLKDNQIVRNMWWFLLVIFVSMLQAFNFSVAWNWVYEIVLPTALVTILVLLFCHDRKGIEIFLWVFIFSTLGLGYEAVFRFISGEVVGLNETGIGGFQFATAEQGLAENHNAVANYFLSIIPLLWYFGLRSNHFLMKGIAFGSIVLSFYGVLISGSRGGMVGLVVTLVVMGILSKHYISFFVCSVVLMILTLPLMGKEFLERMSTILDFGASDTSSSSRISGLVHGIEMMIKRPILGVGPGCYPVARKAWFNWSLWAHNHYGQLAGELGLVGVVVWYQFAKNYINRAWQLLKQNSNPWAKNIAQAAFVMCIQRLVLGMFDHSLYRFGWYIMAAIVVLINRDYSDNSKEN